MIWFEGPKTKLGFVIFHIGALVCNIAQMFHDLAYEIARLMDVHMVLCWLPSAPRLVGAFLFVLPLFTLALCVRAAGDWLLKASYFFDRWVRS